MTGQPMRTGALAQEGDIANGRVAIGFLALGDVGDRLKGASVGILRTQPPAAVESSRHAFGAVQPDEIPPGDPVHHTPNLFARTGFDIRRRGLALRPSFQVEPEAISADPGDPPFERAHAAATAAGVAVSIEEGDGTGGADAPLAHGTLAGLEAQPGAGNYGDLRKRRLEVRFGYADVFVRCLPKPKTTNVKKMKKAA